MSIEDIFYNINKYMEVHVFINTDVLCITGTKYEANANKNTFIWRKNTIRNRTKRWKKTLLCIQRINTYYSLLKEPSIDYLLTITDKIELYMKNQICKLMDKVGFIISNTKKSNFYT